MTAAAVTTKNFTESVVTASMISVEYELMSERAESTYVAQPAAIYI